VREGGRGILNHHQYSHRLDCDYLQKPSMGQGVAWCIIDASDRELLPSQSFPGFSLRLCFGAQWAHESGIPHVTDTTLQRRTWYLEDSPSGRLLRATSQGADKIGPISSRATAHRRRSIISGENLSNMCCAIYTTGFRRPMVECGSNPERVLLLKLDGKEDKMN
jgi:hypothetical protein